MFFLLISSVYSKEVTVKILQANPSGAQVQLKVNYSSMVTLYIEHDDGTYTPAGWSTRKEKGGDGNPFSFQPGVGLIQGWTDGVLKMREGERAELHVPAALGYGNRDMGTKGSGWYIPANSNLMFDIEIFSRDKKDL